MTKRVVASSGTEESIDGIKDPIRLAHDLTGLTSDKCETPYLSYIRASSLFNACVREKVLGFQNSVSAVERTDVSLRVTFDIGNAVHAWLQNSDQYFGIRKIGWWVCTHCGDERFGKPRLTSCEVCSGKLFIYREHAFCMSNPFRVTGHMDLMLECGPGDIRVSEIKTIAGEEFSKLTSPRADHVFQVTTYLMLAEMDESLPVRVNSRKSLLIYVSKGHQKNSFPMKIFHVERDASVEALIVEKLLDFTKGIRDGKVSAPHPDCSKSDFKSYRSRICPVVSICREAQCA